MGRLLASGLVLVALGALLAGCGGGAAPRPVEVGAEADGSSVRLEPGQELRITLASNPTTGYSWAETAPADPGVLRLVSNDYVQGGSDAPGAGGTQVLVYEAVGEGMAAISLAYLRTFEPDSPIDGLALSVTVE